MAILDEDIQQVREATNIVDLIGEQVSLKRVGQRFVGLCPFHDEKTPSFNVNPDMNRYYCFGCQESGDAIQFVIETEHLDFPTAVERLAARANITLRSDDGAAGKQRKKRARLVEA